MCLLRPALVRIVLLAAPLSACRPKSASVDGGASAPIATVNVPSAPRVESGQVDARAVIERWNRAHNDHDVAALASLYAPTVSFYGTMLSGTDCASKKRLAFAQTPDYTQSIRDVKLEAADAGQMFVRLVKTSTTNGKSKDYPAIVILDASGKIADESDDLADDGCIDKTGPPTVHPIANDRVLAPFRISAGVAIVRARSSKHFEHFSKPVGDIDVECAKRCAVQAHECGFVLTLHDMDPHGMDDPTLTVSSWMGVAYVEPVTKTLWWDDFAVDGASVWQSERL
jgi:hypothetical protein